MFKLAASLYFGAMFLTIIILLAFILTTSCVQKNAIILLTQLEATYQDEIREFESKMIAWTHDVYEAAKAFDVKADRDLNEELKRLNYIIDGLKKKNSKCVEDQKSEIAALFNETWYYTCSNQTLQKADNILNKQLGRINSLRKPVYFSDLKKCLNDEHCLKLVNYKEKTLENLLSTINEYTKKAKYITNENKKELEDCFKVSKLKEAGEDIIKKINECADLNL